MKGDKAWIQILPGLLEDSTAFWHRGMGVPAEYRSCPASIKSYLRGVSVILNALSSEIAIVTSIADFHDFTRGN